MNYPNLLQEINFMEFFQSKLKKTENLYFAVN